MQDNFLGISLEFDESISKFQGITLELTENLIVKVVDSLGNAVDGATVLFQIGSDTEEAITQENGTVGFLVENQSTVTVSAVFECLTSPEVDILHGGIDDFRSITLTLVELPCLKLKPENEYNFLRFQLSNSLVFPITRPIDICRPCNGVDFEFEGLQRQTERNEIFTPTLRQGENYSFFTNWADEINLIDIVNVSCALVEECEGVNPSQTFEVQNIIVDGQRYFYADFTINNGIQNGFYRLMLFNNATNQIYFISNIIEVDSEVDLRKTSLIKYRNSDDIDGFKYADLPDFYNKIRVNMYQNGAPIPEPEIESENTITTAEFRYISTAQRKAYPVEVDGYDEQAMRSLESFLAHDEIYVNNKRYNPDLESLSYEELDPTYPLMYGRFNLFDFSYARKNKYK